MSFRFTLVVLAPLLLLLPAMALAQPAPATPPAPDRLTEVRAADLISELLTYYGDLSISRADSMRTFMDEIGKGDEFKVRIVNVPKPTRMTFQEVFQSAVLFIQQGGSKYSDPALAKMTPPQLETELIALQEFNLQQFLFFNSQRDQIAKIRAYLESIGQFDEYLTWSQKRMADPMLSTTGPATRSIQAGANWLADQLAHARAKAWEKAKAKGMTEEEFDAQWKMQINKVKDDSEKRVDAMQSAGSFFHPRSTYVPPAATEAAGNAAVGGTNNSTIAPAPAVSLPPLGSAPSAFATNPMSINDPRWKANYYGPSNPYNDFGDNYSDVMASAPASAGGVYRNYDKRVNSDYDARVQGELDRRINVGNDRRLNIRTDPRVNF